MPHHTLVSIFLITLTTLALGLDKTVTVYTYDSLASKHSFGKYFATELEKTAGIKTQLVSFSTAAEAIQQVKVEGAKTKADVLWGFDGLLLEKAEPWLDKLDAKLIERVPAAIRFDSNKAVPFDYGYLAFVYDSRRTKPATGKKFTDWVKDPTLNKKVIIEDPRTSSLGQSLLGWVGALVPKEGYLDFWKGFAPLLVTVAPGWSSAYGAFLKKECDYVLSYTTSPAYHLVEEKSDAFKTVVFVDGHFRQTEGVGVVKASTQKGLAGQWVEALLSDKFQSALPTRQWMYPAVAVKLPPEFDKLAKVKETPTMATATLEANRTYWTSQWTKALITPR